MKDSFFSQYFSRQSPNFFYDVENLPNLCVSCFEGASLDARNFQQLSEDFFAYQYQNNIFCMVLCDGVGQTRDAELAASLFGKKILGYLPTINEKKEYLEKISYELRSVISDEIDHAPLSEDAPRHHKQARQNDGAQVKFACCIIDFNKRMVEIYWAGDVRFIVYDKSKKIIKSVSEDNHQFWSTKSNYSLNLEYYSISIESVSRISMTSDGIRENIKNILNNKMYLDNVELAKLIYQDGVDDISGIDVKISTNDDLKHLPTTKNIKILEHKLSWDATSNIEKYRFYYSNQKKIEFLANVNSNERTYIIPQDINFDDIYVQAISSNNLSSNLFKPTKTPEINRLPDPLPTPTLFSPLSTVVMKNNDKDKIEVRPNRLRFWLILSSILFFVCASTAVVYLLFPLGITFVPNATPTIMVSTYTEIIVTKTMTNTPSFTPVFTETTTTLLTEIPTQTSEISIETATPLPDISSLNDCQREFFLLDPEQYQTPFYQIQSGDTLFAIAETYSVSVEDIKRANCLTDNLIRPGEYLLIPQNR